MKNKIKNKIKEITLDITRYQYKYKISLNIKIKNILYFFKSFAYLTDLDNLRCFFVSSEYPNCNQSQQNYRAMNLWKYWVITHDYVLDKCFSGKMPTVIFLEKIHDYIGIGAYGYVVK